jgi:hypothetical protein
LNLARSSRVLDASTESIQRFFILQVGTAGGYHGDGIIMIDGIVQMSFVLLFNRKKIICKRRVLVRLFTAAGISVENRNIRFALSR